MRAELSLSMLLILILALPATSADNQIIGVIKTVKGNASIARNQQMISATLGIKLNVGDVLQTGQDSSLGMILRDDSILSMGPSSQLVINEFLYIPAEGKLGLLIKIMRGTIAYLTGVIGKLSPGTARFETPVATIGVRGTHFAAKVEANELQGRSNP